MDQAKHEQQIMLEAKYDKNQVIPRIKREFTDCKEFSFDQYFEDKEIPLKFGYDVLTQMALHKRCNLPTLVAILLHHLKNAQATADMILKCVEADLLDWNPVLKQFIVKFTISDDVQRELDKYQFPLPMVVEPKEITNNRETGYLTSKGSLILRKNHHDEDICIDHINRMNKVALSINHQTATMVKNQWRNLDKPKEGETREDFNRRKKAFEKFDRTAHEVIDELITHENRFYLTHRFDKRGRTYAHAYHLSTQGNPWSKAIIELADKELVE